MENKPQIDVRVLIARLNRESAGLQEREFIAPLLPGGRIQTRLNGLVYQFKPKGRFVGWGRFHPLNEREAEILGEALPWQKAEYLKLFPALKVILLWSIMVSEVKTQDSKLIIPQSGAWWALPYNEGDARQRFGFGGELLPVFLADPRDGAERFERAIARVAGQQLWFEGPDLTADPQQAEWLRDSATLPDAPEKFLAGLAASQRAALLFWQLHQLELKGEVPSLQSQSPRQQHEKLREWVRQSKLEQELQHALAKADATLHNFSEIIGEDGASAQLLVEWSERGQTCRYRSVIDAKMSVISSGICLSGRDRDFDLTSLVNVITQED